MPKISQLQNGGGRIRLEGPGTFTPSPSGEQEAASLPTPVLSPCYLQTQIHLGSLNVRVYRECTKWNAFIFQTHEGEVIFQRNA